MRRFAPLLAVLTFSPSAALAADPGGAAAPGSTVPVAQAGGVEPGRGVAPMARLSASARRGVPNIRLRVDEPGVASVTARVVVLRSPGNDVVAELPLGAVRTGRTVAVPWKAGPLAAGRYVVRVHARDRWANQLRRTRGRAGKTTMVIRAAPKPSAPEPAAPTGGDGVFPIDGPFTYGDGLGADRGDHSHQGQDMAAAAGTPIVAPTAGTVVSTAHQASGAGYYVVMNATDGHSYFFAHCQKSSFGVQEGDAVAAGTLLCRVGSTGRSSGPHLHFEIWANGWRTGKESKPIDPLPFLKAWEQ